MTNQPMTSQRRAAPQKGGMANAGRIQKSYQILLTKPPAQMTNSSHTMLDFSEAIEELIEDVEADPDKTLTEVEQNIMNAVEVANITEEEGLHGFWMSPLNHDALLKSLDDVGAHALLDLFQSSQWCGTKSPDQELNEVELGHLEDIESELTPMLTELPGQLQEYLDDEI